MRAMLAYEPGPYDGRVILLRAAEAFSEELASPDPAAGWGRIGAEIEVHEVPGDHYSMFTPPFVDALGRRLRMHLARAESGARR